MLHWRVEKAALITLFVTILLGVTFSPLPKRSAAELPSLLGGITLYWILAERAWPARYIAYIWWGLIFIGALLCAIAPAGMLGTARPVWGQLSWVAALQRYVPDTFNANVVAGTLVVLLPFSVAKGLTGRPYDWKGWMRQSAAIGVGVAMLVVLLWAGSRGGLLAAGIGLGLLGILHWPRMFRWVIPLLLLAGFVRGIQAGWHPILDALMTSDATVGLPERLEIWSRALDLIADFPLFGAGLGCFEVVVKLMYPLFLVQRGTVSHAHNLFLQVAVDLGLPGLAAYLVLLGIAFHRAHVAYRTFAGSRWQDLAALAAACLASLAGMCAHGLIDCAVWGNKGAFLPWIVLGLCAVLARCATSPACVVSSRSSEAGCSHPIPDRDA